MRVREDTMYLFNQSKAYVIDYLEERGVSSIVLKNIIMDYPFGLLDDVFFLVEGEKYGISHFLSQSDNVTGYDIKKVNELLQTDRSNDVVFAVLIGDDVLCYNIKSQDVYIWLVQTGDGEKIHVCSDLDVFLRKICNYEKGVENQ